MQIIQDPSIHLFTEFSHKMHIIALQCLQSGLPKDPNMAFNYWPNIFLLRQFLSQRMPWFSSLPVQILPDLQTRLKDDFPDFSHWDEVSSTLESLYS